MTTKSYGSDYATIEQFGDLFTWDELIRQVSEYLKDHGRSLSCEDREMVTAAMVTMKEDMTRFAEKNDALKELDEKRDAIIKKWTAAEEATDHKAVWAAWSTVLNIGIKLERAALKNDSFSKRNTR